jgi:hypothetical protein
MEKIHDAKAAMIGVNNPHPIIERENNMVMEAGASINRTLFKIKFPQILGQRFIPQNSKAPGHAEMHQESMTVIKVNQNIFGPPLQTQNLPAPQSGGKIGWKGKTKAGSAKFHASDGMPDENGD